MTKLWFKAKRYGYGWYPCSWEGWAALGIWAVIFFAILYGINDTNWLLRSLASFLVTGLLIFVSYKKGEPARWRWGKKDKKSRSKK